MTNSRYKVGDWVRIMRGGSLVLAEIRYVKDDGWKTHYTYDNHGGGDDDDILEARRYDDIFVASKEKP